MPRWLPVFLCAAALFAPSAGACTWDPTHSTRSVRVVLFLGAARTDTILVGSAGVSVGRAAGHFGAGGAREVYGQVVGVERVGEPWRSLLPRGTREVVLVPWDYAADCSPVFWSRSARWLEPGTSGLFRGTLRERDHWVGGRPTLDVFAPEFEPYPSAAGLAGYLRMVGADDTAPPPMLSPEEALDFYSQLPTDSMVWAPPDTALAAVRRWAEAHPVLAARWPAAPALGMLEGRVERLQFRRRTSPLAGTYRFSVTFASGDSLLLFARTEKNLLHSITTVALGEEISFADTPAVGYNLLTHFRSTREELPERHPGPDRQGYVSALLAPLVATPESTVWRGDVDLFGVIRQVETRQGILSAQRELTRPLPIPRLPPGAPIVQRPLVVMDLLRDSATYRVPGLFTAFPDGRVRFEWLGRRGDTTIVAIRGERISTETLLGPFAR